MFRKFLLLSVLLIPAFVFSQNPAQTETIYGLVTGNLAGEPGVKVSLVGTTTTVTTDGNGRFEIQLTEGHRQLQFTHSDYDTRTIDFPVNVHLHSHTISLDRKENLPLPTAAQNPVVVDAKPAVQPSAPSQTTTPAPTYKVSDLNALFADSSAENAPYNEDNIPTSTLSDDGGQEDGTQNISPMVGSTRDAFTSAASFTFSAARFRVRGYDNKNFTTYLNGAPVNDLENGRASFGNWGGLNNVVRNRKTTYGLEPSTAMYGEPGGTSAMNMRASAQRKEFNVSYLNTNRNYRHRVMATYSTGLMKNGWAVSASISHRWAKEGYIAGTFYDGTSFYLAVEKNFHNGHALSLTGFGSSVKSGLSASATPEMFDLAGSHYYNYYWGYQNGKKRNSAVSNVFQPTFVLAHDWKMNNHETMTTSASFTFGKRERTGIDFYNAENPRPDYYRFLPSYIPDSSQQVLAIHEFQTNPNLLQTNWDGFYEANYMSYDSINNANGVAGNKEYGKRARYVLFNDIADTRKFNFASTYNNNINSHITLTAGIAYQFQQTEYYKKLQDLLGADFFVDVNQFAERDFPDSFSIAQNDLNHPNRILHEGDKYNYDYFVTNHKGSVWAQSIFHYNKVDFFISGEFAVNAFWRTGKTRYGLFADNSEGKSAVKIFPNGGVKGGLTYKINGRNSLYLNGGYESRAPLSQNGLMSARTQNGFVSNLKNETVYTAELGYILQTANIKLKADMYFTQFNDQTQLRRFYHDDFRTFVNYSLTGVNTRHWGGELGIEAKIWRGFSATAAVGMGRYTYTSRPQATITYDNNPALSTTEKVYFKNFNVSGTPQLATTFGIRYRAPQFWFANVNFNYYDWMWANVNPARRTEGAVDLVDPNSSNFGNIIDQERLKGQFTMDISVGYSWLINGQFRNLKKRYFLIFNASVNNVTNNRNLVTGASEQLRFDFYTKNANKFPTRYSYAYGATYSVGVAFRMQ